MGEKRETIKAKIENWRRNSFHENVDVEYSVYPFFYGMSNDFPSFSALSFYIHDKHTKNKSYIYI